jgi:uncharacterized membrane protein
MATSKSKKVFRRIFRWFIEGIILIAPISITAYVLYKAFELVDGILPFKIPGLGLLVILLIITLIGLLGSTIIGRPLMAYYNRLLDKIPLIKLLYSSIKDLMSAFVGQKKKFTEPVLVKMSKDSEIEKLGFLTQKDLSLLGLDNTKVAVYFPHSYNFSGNLFIVPAANVKAVDISPTEIMKFIVSGGVTELGDTVKETVE